MAFLASINVVSAVVSTAVFVAISAVSVSLCGCASDPTGPTFLVVPHDQYVAAFDAAAEAARQEGLVPEIADRQSGLIGTAARTAGSVLEPWDWRDLTASEVVSGTFAFERRRAHFEFVPAGFHPIAPEGTAPLVGPALPGSERDVGESVTAVAGNLELRVSVSIERQFRPGFQSSPYTRSRLSYSTDVTNKDDASTLRDRSSWTPVARDERLERILIERITALLTQSADQ